jgi:hypothetical protein
MTTHFLDEILTMTDTLTTAPVAPLLARLFAEAPRCLPANSRA